MYTIQILLTIIIGLLIYIVKQNKHLKEIEQKNIENRHEEILNAIKNIEKK